MRSFLQGMWAPVLLFALTLSSTMARAEPIVADLFGRDVLSYGLTVPDWEGYMANPAIEFTITPPPDAASPIRAALSTVENKLYFDNPSQSLAEGARKELVFTGRGSQTVFIAVFPARKKQNEETSLSIALVDGRGRRAQLMVPVHIAAVESHDHSPPFPITVDFSQDKTGFYANAEHRAVFQQAVADWAFYLQDMQLQPVAAGAEKTRIFEPDGFSKSNVVTNTSGYSGYLLYAYGIDDPEIRSGGEPSAGGFQRDATGRLAIRRSGGVETETRGNYNKLGWLPARLAEEQWWRDTNLGDVPNDLYSIVHHEMGHALFFNPTNRNFPRNAVFKDKAVRAYLGSDIKTDLTDHFNGVIDPVSLHGAFGNEYHGKAPFGRWLITKTDLLCAQAVGYHLRKTAPLMAVSFDIDHLPDAPLRRPYTAAIAVQGGIPVYDWQADPASLPPGLSLNRFNGQITGNAVRPGDYSFTVKVRDYDPAGKGVSGQIQVKVSE